MQQSLAIKNRTYQVTFLISLSFLFYQLTDWVEGMWVPISVITILVPFGTFLSLNKARSRFFGTMLGLFLALMLQYYLRFFPGQMPLVATLFMFVFGFMISKEYKYLVIFITMATCLVFSYMNMAYTSFAPESFLVSRMMGVFTGVALVVTFQTLVFGASNALLELQEEAENLCQLIKTKYSVIAQGTSASEAFNIALDVNNASKSLAIMLESAEAIDTRNKDLMQYATEVLTLKDAVVNELLSFKNTGDLPLKAYVEQIETLSHFNKQQVVLKQA